MSGFLSLGLLCFFSCIAGRVRDMVGQLLEIRLELKANWMQKFPWKRTKNNKKNNPQNTPQQAPNNNTTAREKCPVGDISVVTLIRTDTTLDHSQKAEKVFLLCDKPTPRKNFLHCCAHRDDCGSHG